MFNQPGDRGAPRAGVRDRARRLRRARRHAARPSATLWWGAGYAVAQDRLFELELFRRATTGRLAEILGKGYLDDDLVARRDYYTPAELDAHARRSCPPTLQRALPGLPRRRQRVDRPRAREPGRRCPASSSRSAIAARGLDACATRCAVGVYLARTVPTRRRRRAGEPRARCAARGGGRFDKLAAAAHARASVTTIPPSRGRVPVAAGPHAQATRRAALRALAALRRRALPLPAEGRRGRGRGAASRGRSADRVGLGRPGRLVHVRGRAAADGHAFLFNGPQLGFAAPERFVELELHAPGHRPARRDRAGRAGRSASATTSHVAWGFTSGAVRRRRPLRRAARAGRPGAVRLQGQGPRRWTAATSASPTARPPSDLLERQPSVAASRAR